MSKAREENPELARVLSRVDALMQHDEIAEEKGRPQEPSVTKSAADEEEVPVLTEVYEGQPLNFAPRELEEVAGTDLLPVDSQQDREERLEAILQELLPLIRAEVKKAVRQELVNTEKIVNHRLETEFIQTVLDKLRKGES